MALPNLQLRKLPAKFFRYSLVLNIPSPLKTSGLNLPCPHRNKYLHPNFRHHQPFSFHPKALAFKNKCRNFAAITKDM